MIRWFYWFPVVVLVITMSVSTMAADSLELDRLKDEVRRLQGELNMLQKEFYRLPKSGNSDSRGKPKLEVQMTQLQEQMRSIEGRFEEYDYRIERMQQSLEEYQQQIADQLAMLSTQAVQPDNQEVSEGVVLQKKAEGVVIEDMPVANALSVKQESEPVTLSPSEQYEQAFALLRQGDYGKAQKVLQDFIVGNEGNELVENATFWLAEIYYVKEDYSQAAVYFMKGYKQFPDGVKVINNLLKLGMSLAKLEKKTQACVTWQKALDDFPSMPDELRAQIDQERQGLSCQV